jgi:hypothetical protein
MTEFELASLHSAMYVQAQSALSTFLTAVSGFLVVSYFAAHRIDLTMTAVGLAIYLGFSAFIVAGTSRTLQTYAGVSQEIKAFAAAGRGLAWHGAATAPTWILEVLPFFAFAAGSIAVAGSVYFFFHCRRLNLKDQAGAWRPKV